MAPSDPIERINDDAEAIIGSLSDPSVASARMAADDIFRRALVLAIGSYYERRIFGTIENFCHQTSSANVELCAFVKNKALFRTYHTCFSWDSGNANTFLKLFGQAFFDEFTKKIRLDPKLSDGVKCFISLGQLRNKLAHESFADYQFDLTREDVMRSYRDALHFVVAFENSLK